MANEKKRWNLGNKIFLSALAMCFILCAAALAAGCGWYHHQMEAGLEQAGHWLSASLEAQLSPEAVERYDTTGETDERYNELQNLVQELAEQDDIERVCVVRPREDRAFVLFDSASRTGGALGTQLGPEDWFSQYIPRLQGLRTVDSAVDRDRTGDGGWRMTILYPIAYNDGTVAGYILTVINMDEAVGRQWSMLLQMGLLLAVLMAVVLAAYLYFVRRSVITPIRRLIDAVQAYEGGENKASLRSLELKGNDELRTLADAFRMMLVEIDLRGFEERELAVREERVEAELKLTTAINQAMTPKALPREAGRLAFDVRGMSEQSGELSRDFYDYFLLEGGRLGVVVGAVPSEGVSAALFMVVAKTAIKSQLRVGMSILDAVEQANRQLYEVGQGMVVNAIIGVLDEDGAFSYVNAGQQLPLLMRAQDRYEWQSAPVYAPLGQNENVTYQVRRISLRQGDRLFFHTAGLDDIVGAEDERFGAQRMQAMLNASRSKHLSLDHLLTYMHDEGMAFAVRPQSVGGFTILALDYLRARKDLAHCVVDRDRNGAAQVSDFLKRQLSENGFSQRAVAHTVVLADEVFALCCRQKTEGLITVECAVDRNKSLVTLHLKSAFGGMDPLQIREGTDVGNALEFIRASARQLSFQPGEPQDVLTIVTELKETKQA